MFLHAIYLINLGAPSRETLEKGIDSLVNYMNLAAEIGVGVVVVHPGSHAGKGFQTVFPQRVDALKIVLDAFPEGTVLALEIMVGMGKHIGVEFDELTEILEGSESCCLKICLVTQYAFATVYDLIHLEGIQAMLDESDARPRCANAVAVHANDSKRL